MIGDLISGVFGFLGARKQQKADALARQQNISQQREFAQKSIRWRVKDAKAAGIHPLAALGAAGSQYQPVGASSAAGEGLKEIGRAVGSAASKVSPQARLARQAVQSEIGVNEAQAALYEAQAITTLRAAEGGVRGQMAGTNPLIDPEVLPSHIKIRDPRTGKEGWIQNPDIMGDFGERIATKGAVEAAMADPAVRAAVKRYQQKQRSQARKGATEWEMEVSP